MGRHSIQVSGISKSYQIGRTQTKHDTFRDSLAGAFHAGMQRLRGAPATESEWYWALKDVSFDVEQGEVVGIIGRNGAGKSTLLKILSRITDPTEGRAELVGRVGSLLEVGTGFHPELSGRENIYLNGAILGMRKAEIDRKLEEIVEFAGVGRFLDTPVKRYSTGMYLRLAFAVAANMETEILLVDEVLAVGDSEFQNKCLGKMRDVAKSGRTVVFVSHNMGAVRQLCDSCILLKGGTVFEQGDPEKMISFYLGSPEKTHQAVVDTSEWPQRSGTGAGRILEVGLYDELRRPTIAQGVGRPFSVRMRFQPPHGGGRFMVGLEVSHWDGTHLINIRSDSQGISFMCEAGQGAVEFEVCLPGLPLYPGTYRLEPWVGEILGKRVDQLHGCFALELESQGVFASEGYIQPGRGVLLLDCEFRHHITGDV